MKNPDRRSSAWIPAGVLLLALLLAVFVAWLYERRAWLRTPPGSTTLCLIVEHSYDENRGEFLSKVLLGLLLPDGEPSDEGRMTYAHRTPFRPSFIQYRLQPTSAADPSRFPKGFHRGFRLLSADEPRLVRIALVDGRGEVLWVEP